MVLALVLAAAASAAPVAPSFEAMLHDARSLVLTARRDQIKTKDAGLAGRLDRAGWDAQTREREASSARRELSSLRTRLMRYSPPRNGQRDPDPGLRWEVQRVARDLQSHARELQWNLQELRAIRSAITDKDPDLVAPASRLESAVRWLASEERWLETDGRWIGSDLRRAGFSFEAFDYDRALRDAADYSRQLDDETQAILAKVR